MPNSVAWWLVEIPNRFRWHKFLIGREFAMFNVRINGNIISGMTKFAYLDSCSVQNAAIESPLLLKPNPKKNRVHDWHIVD